jgi:murein hydrolase activator
MAERQTELAAVKIATAEISKSVGDLSDLITKLDQTVTEKTGLGAYQHELKQQPPAVLAATAAAGPQAPSPAPTPAPVAAVAPPPGVAEPPAKETQLAALTPPPRLKPQIVELAPSGTSLVPGSPGRIKPAIPFSSARAKLPLPAQGRRVLAFGERTQYGGQSKGLVIETRAQAQVTAPCDGWVVFAGEFRSYGQLLIINAGDGYHVLLAGMSQIDVQPGQFVLASEPVGTMSGTPKSQASTAQISAPVLYVEFRKDGRPIDPDPWWVAGQQKVQG